MFTELLETCMLWSFFKFQLNFDPAKEILKYDLRFIFFIQKNHSEENASASEDFYSTILQPFQFEPERKKTVDNEKETTQAVVSRNSLKWVFLKISQISQENASVGVSFNKVPSLKVCNFIKKRF